MFAFRRRRNGPRRLVLRPRGFDETPISFYQSTSLWWLGRARLGLGIPIAALLFASFLGLLLFTVFLGESRNSERKTDGQGEDGNNGFHGAFPLRMGGQPQSVSARIASGLNLLNQVKLVTQGSN